jgi:hypothetical protein
MFNRIKYEAKISGDEMSDDKEFLLDFLDRAAQPVQWHGQFSGKLNDFPQWSDESFRNIVSEHGFLSDDIAIISHGVANPGSLACQDLWKLESGKKSIILMTTEPKIREFGGVM